jgi:uncharacterized Zn-finger protein
VPLNFAKPGLIKKETVMATHAAPATASAPGVEETIQTHNRTVACDGGGVLGHPRVYLRIEGSEILCPYCSRRYILAAGAGDDHGH